LERGLKPAIAEMYVQGVSTRKVAEVMEALCGMVEVTSREDWDTDKVYLKTDWLPGMCRYVTLHSMKSRGKPLNTFLCLTVSTEMQKSREAGGLAGDRCPARCGHRGADLRGAPSSARP